MADLAITELTALTATPALDDVLPIVDVSEAAAGDRNKKITTNYLFSLLAGLDALADHGYHGITLTGRNYGYTAAIGDPVYLDDTAGEWLLADAEAATPTPFPARGVACNVAGDGEAAIVMVLGVMRHDAWAFTEGQTLYLSDGSAISGTAPAGSGDCIQVVGFALSDDEAFLNFTGVYAEHA